MNTSTKQTENLAECGNKSKPLLSSRLFKFRAWNENIKLMSKPFKFGQVLNFHDQIIKSLTTDEIVMQFTGLIDKNNKEIYEGDILKDADGNKSKVDFNSGSFGCYDSTEKIWLSFCHCFTKYDLLEVVGNIFENP